MRIDSKVLDALGNTETDGNVLRIKAQLERSLYVAVNKVLEAAGGKWNRKAQGHVFDGDAGEIIDQIVLTGEVLNAKQELGDFPSPPAVVETLLARAQIEQGMLALEPSAGSGAIAVPMAKAGAIVHCFEINKSHAEKLASRLLATAPEYMVKYGDFLEVDPLKANFRGDLYDRIVMNPPFAKQADVRHVLHALKFLAPGGRLVSVMSAGITFRTTSLTRELREVIDALGEIETLPEGSFAESGTMVNTVIVTIDK